ncbi:nitroreductase family protein [Streptomyces sp. NPDC048251]|uniref:nitroreductase family protein n=1 Tax=Streptomyces sp. NPDC048251 TaxID=3154501 RepID=UPI00341C8A0D
MADDCAPRRGTALPGTAPPFTDIARSRRSPRQFLPTALSPSDIRGVLEDAQTAPSNSNTQPWTVHPAAVTPTPHTRVTAATSSPPSTS